MADKTLENIKIVLGIEDKLQDPVLDILISNVTSHLKGLLGKEVPAGLNYIIEEITIRRYNRVGTEGMKSESVEGHKIDFYDLKDEFVPYLSIIDDYKDDEEIEPRRGKVMFI